MGTIFHHTNIVSHDPDRLAAFYMEVFGFELSGPERNLSGDWIERGTGHPGARIRGLMLKLPQNDDTATKLEIFRFEGLDPPTPARVTRPGLMHVCFVVDDVHETMERLIAAGGDWQGEIVDTGLVPGVGSADFLYARDPDGNIVELLSWKYLA